jgi:hypothetical protein
MFVLGSFEYLKLGESHRWIAGLAILSRDLISCTVILHECKRIPAVSGLGKVDFMDSVHSVSQLQFLTCSNYSEYVTLKASAENYALTYFTWRLMRLTNSNFNLILLRPRGECIYEQNTPNSCPENILGTRSSRQGEGADKYCRKQVKVKSHGKSERQFTVTKEKRNRRMWGFHGGDYEEWCLQGCYAVWLL